MLFLFWFIVLSLLSSWDKMDVCVEFLADDVWVAEDNKTGLLTVGVGIFGSIIFVRTTNFLAHGAD